MLVLAIYLFSLNFKSIEIDGERASSSQNERSLGGEKGCSKTSKREQSEMGGGKGVKTRESCANVLFECRQSVLGTW